QKFSMGEQHREVVEAQGVEAVLLEIGEGHVELLKPLDSETAVGKFLASRGPGLHHVAYQTSDIDAALEQVKAAGLELIDDTPRNERIVKAFSKLGEHGLLWQGIALGGAAVDSRRRPEWLRAWAVVAGSFGANQLVKLAFRRPRPDLPELPPLMDTVSNRSYPSAHATTSAAAARVLSPLVGAPLYPLAVAMSLSR